MKIVITLIERWATNLPEKDAIKRALVDLLSSLDPKEPFGTELFEAIARVTVSVAIEVIPWRVNAGGGIDLLLNRRKPDEAYANLLHTVGTVMRSGEDIETDTIPRLARRELGEGCRFSSVTFVGNLNGPGEARGHFFTPVYISQLEGAPEDGEWWPIDSLPPIDETVREHSTILWPMAIEAIKSQMSGWELARGT